MKQNSAAISHPSLLTACQMALAVTSGLNRTFAVSGLVTHYINAHDHRNLLSLERQQQQQFTSTARIV
jgi:hypothetical protein